VASPVAGRIPATCTALGKALLAHNPVAIEDATRSDLVRRTRHSITQAAVLRSQLAQVRRVGFAFEYQEARIGLARVASPVMTGKSAAAAIWITGPSDPFDPLLSARRVHFDQHLSDGVHRGHVICHVGQACSDGIEFFLEAVPEHGRLG
jgi:DNA-binding IclR family transcriptional regulator